MWEYKTYTNNKGQKVVLCLTKYNGKTIRGKAICHPSDVYDEELGKTIAYNRCETEYLRRRIQDTYKYRQSILFQIKQLQAKYDQADNLFRTNCLKYQDLVEAGEKLEKEISGEKENS